MNKAIRRSVISLVLAAGPVLAVAPATPAHACNGEICDSICDFWTFESGNSKVDNLNDKITPGDCPIR